jgi:hypothetical protein
MDSEDAAKLAIKMARQIEALDRQVAQLRGSLDEIRAAAVGARVLPVRDMILAALEYASPDGLTRSEIAAAIRRDYGIEISVNTLTGTLSRMNAAATIRRVGQAWFMR